MARLTQWLRRFTQWQRRCIFLGGGLTIGIAIGLHVLPGALFSRTLHTEAAFMGLSFSAASCDLSLLTDSAEIHDVTLRHSYPDSDTNDDARSETNTPFMSCERITCDPDLMSVFHLRNDSRLLIQDIHMYHLRMHAHLQYDAVRAWIDAYTARRAQRAPTSSRTGFVIEHLSLSGDALLLPPSYNIDICSFRLEGHHLSNDIHGDEQMRITCFFRSLQGLYAHISAQTQLVDGHLHTRIDGSISHFPLALLSHDDLATETLRLLNPSGYADITFSCILHKNETEMTATLTSQDVTLHPQPQAHFMMHLIAQQLDAAQQLGTGALHEPFSLTVHRRSQAGKISVDYGIAAFVAHITHVRNAQMHKQAP